MPSVASPPPARAPVAPPAMPAAPSTGAPASPFESLLDDSTQTAAPPAPLPTNKPAAPAANPRQPQAQSDTATPQPPPQTDGGAPAATAPAQAGKATVGTGISQPSGVKANGTAVAAVEFQAPAVPARTVQAPGDNPAGDTNADGSGDRNATGNVKADGKTATQAVAADVLKPASKDKPAAPAKATDDTPAPASDPAQPLVVTADTVVAGLAPAAAPVTPGPGKPAAKDAAVVADGTSQQGIVASPQTTAGKTPDDSKAADKAAAPTGEKLQPASGAADKQPDTQTVTTNTADRQPAPAPLDTGTHAADAKTADMAAPPGATVQPSSAVPAQAAPAPAPAAQPLPQAAAIPVSGVAIEIAGKALAGKNRFEIRLDPPELGRIEVRLDVDKDGRITSHVIADRRDTLDLLQRDASGLQRALQDAGLKTSDNGLQFSLRDQPAGQQQQNANPGNAAQLVVEDDAPLDVMPTAYNQLAGLAGGLDIRV